MFKPVLVFATVCASASAFAPAAAPGLVRTAARPTAVCGLRMQSSDEAAKAKLDAESGPTPVSTGGT
eukprot:1734637-Rhodomonas_salina.1